MKRRWLTSEDIKLLKNLARKQVADGVVDINPSEYEEVFVKIDKVIDNEYYYLEFDISEMYGLLQLHSDLGFVVNKQYAIKEEASLEDQYIKNTKVPDIRSIVREQEAIKRLFG